MPSDAALQLRPEFENKGIEKAVVGDIERRLTLWERLSNMDPVRKLSVLVLVIVSWELYTRIGDINELMFPTFSATGAALVNAVVNDGLLINVWNSLSLLLTGYVIGIGIAVILAIADIVVWQKQPQKQPQQQQQQEQLRRGRRPHPIRRCVHPNARRRHHLDREDEGQQH